MIITLPKVTNKRHLSGEEVEVKRRGPLLCESVVENPQAKVSSILDYECKFHSWCYTYIIEIAEKSRH
jgi:hypothetical protein